ncbi:hypothetical protein [Campylobacter hyointestinalis]|uniref:hypothetical protein n=1 Tax=Campylobacter hyointestinalis TaxID=198 RepID=UPI0012472DF5|nr:hypothetical protein [Campylobacter hyointestinalis]
MAKNALLKSKINENSLKMLWQRWCANFKFLHSVSFHNVYIKKFSMTFMLVTIVIVAYADHSSK